MPSVATPALNDIYEYQEIHLDSFRRDRGDNYGSEWVLKPALSDVMGFKVLSAVLPVSFYGVDENHNTVSYRKSTDAPDAPDSVLTLVAKPYTSKQLETAFNALADASSANLHLTYDDNTHRFSVNSTSGTTTFVITANSPAAALGFPIGRYILQAANPPLEAPNIAVANGLPYVYLVSSALGTRIAHNVRVNGSSTPPPPNVIAKVPVTENFGNVVFYNDPSATSAFDTSLAQITKIDLAWVAPDTYAPLNMHGAPWSVTIMTATQRDTTIPMRDAPSGNSLKRQRVS